FDLEPLRDALVGAGFRCATLGWDDPAADFSSARMTVLRSTWNYPRVADAFRGWIHETSAVSCLLNPSDLVHWNIHKGYLLELAAAGVPIAPTELVEQGSDRTLLEVAQSRGWRELVVKPAVSASSMATLKVGGEEFDLGEAHLRQLAAERDVLVQEFLSSVDGYGERALVWIDGELTHAVRKSPRFTGEDEVTSTEAVEISAPESSLAERAMAHVIRSFDEPPLYARIDVAPGSNGEPVVMELELIEPSLYFSRSDRALNRMVGAIGSRLEELPEAD
ncbi:MAG: hypothetical protein HKN10_18015, partial [Myxococcales bacterium]|nr:hypothetical protein [Myxococcales bacterium]